MSSFVLHSDQGSVSPQKGIVSIADGLAVSAAQLLHLRELLLEVPGIGDWLVCHFEGLNPNLVQLFPNADRLKSRAEVIASAAVFEGFIGGEWKPFGPLEEGRVGRVHLDGMLTPTNFIIHNVEGRAVEVSAKKEEVSNA